MRWTFSAFALLTSLLLAVTTLPQVGAAAPLPQAADQNTLVAQAQAAIDAKRWADAEAALKQLLASDQRWEYFDALGVAQFNQGRYADSIASYQRALDLGQKSAGPAAIGQMYTTIGNANVKLKKNDAAIAAFDKAAAISPTPAVAYFNLFATLYNMGQIDAKAVAACDKAIAADPKRADAYFVKGSMLFGLGTVQNGKFKVSEAVGRRRARRGWGQRAKFDQSGTQPVVIGGLRHDRTRCRAFPRTMDGPFQHRPGNHPSRHMVSADRLDRSTASTGSAWRSISRPKGSVASC